MPPLPRPNDALVENLGEHAKRAYVVHILPSEDTAVNANRDPLHIRVLGALLIHALTRQASEAVAEDILSANGSYETLDDLGKLYLENFVYFFGSARSRTPLPTEHPSRLSLSAQRAGIQHELVQTPQDHSGAKQNALIRDGFRCMLSGEIEVIVWKANPSAFPDPADTASAGPTSCCHILPKWTNDFSSFGIPENKDARAGADGLWAILDRFSGYEYMRTDPEGPAAVHRLSNVLTLSSKLCTQFEGLELWLEAIPGQEHAYTVHTHPPEARRALRYKEQVHFGVCDVDIAGFPRPALEYLHLPDPRFLALHAACCKVAQMSGVAEYVDKLDRDLEELQVLGEDGGSADVLVYAMSKLLPGGKN